MEHEIADLGYIANYAQELQKQLKEGKQPEMGYVNQMLALAEKVQRSFDTDFAEYVEERGDILVCNHSIIRNMTCEACGISFDGRV